MYYTLLLVIMKGGSNRVTLLPAASTVLQEFPEERQASRPPSVALARHTTTTARNYDQWMEIIQGQTIQPFAGGLPREHCPPPPPPTLPPYLPSLALPSLLLSPLHYLLMPHVITTPVHFLVSSPNSIHLL